LVASADVPEGPAAEAPPAPDAEAPPSPQTRPPLLQTELNALTQAELELNDRLCGAQIHTLGFWDEPIRKWVHGYVYHHKECYYSSTPSMNDIATRIQHDHARGQHPELQWATATAIATEVHEIMDSYLSEKGHQEDLHDTWRFCTGWWWHFYEMVELYRAKRNKEWYGHCGPHILRRRNLLSGNNGFRNALEVALQLRAMGKDSAEIRRMMLDVHWALSGVLDVTDEQLDELLDYDRTFGEGD